MGTYVRHEAAFPGVPAGVRAMRAWLAGYLTGHPNGDSIALVAVELATNAIQHTWSCDNLFCVAIESEEAGTGLTVQDMGADDKPQPDGDGYGLVLVDALADAWGVHGDERSREVWAYWNAAL